MERTRTTRLLWLLSVFRVVWGLRSTLLIGDSVDRYTVQGWCNLHRGGKPREWGTHSIRYVNKYIAHPPQYCHIPKLDLSLASVHIFGTNSTGPYYGGFLNTESDPYADTTPRVHKAWELFVGEFGIPDYVFFHTAQWDIRGLAARVGALSAENNATIVAREVETYRNNLNDRIDELLELVKAARANKPVCVCLRTAAYSSRVENPTMQHDFNEVIRRVAQERSLVLYDMDLDLWSNEAFARNSSSSEKVLFRDFIHPREIFLGLSGEKELNHVYCRYCFWPQNFVGRNYSVIAPFDPTPDEGWSLVSRNDFDPKLLRLRLRRQGIDKSEDVIGECYYSGIVNNSRWAWRLSGGSAELETLRQWLVLGKSDVLDVELPPQSTWANTSWLHLREMPPIKMLSAPQGPSRLAVQTSVSPIGQGLIFMVDYGKGGFKEGIRQIPRPEYLPLFGLSQTDVLHNFDVIMTFNHNFAVADIYREKTLVRYYKDREILWIYSATNTSTTPPSPSASASASVGSNASAPLLSRHPFPDWNTFVSHGLDTGDVVIVYSKEDIDILPLGEPVRSAPLAD